MPQGSTENCVNITQTLENITRQPKRNTQRAKPTYSRDATTARYFDLEPIEIVKKPKKHTKKDEAELQDIIASTLNKAGYLVIRLNSGAMVGQAGNYFKAYFVYGLKKSSGAADLLIFKDNKAVFLEIKSTSGRQSESQKAFEMFAKERGMQYHLVRTIDDVNKLFKLGEGWN